MADNTVKRSVGSNHFGTVRSVTAKGRDNIPEVMAALTPGLAGDNVKRLQKRLDAVTAPTANWINVLHDRPSELELLQQRQRLYEDQGLWGI